MLFNCWDYTGVCVEFEARIAREAAQKYVDSGDWEKKNRTWWCHVWVQPVDGTEEPEQHRVAVDPEPPCCTDGTEVHSWRDEGMTANGGGVRCTERCRSCGLIAVTDTWATDLVDGKQGLTAVEYHLDGYADGDDAA